MYECMGNWVYIAEIGVLHLHTLQRQQIGRKKTIGLVF